MIDGCVQKTIRLWGKNLKQIQSAMLRFTCVDGYDYAKRLVGIGMSIPSYPHHPERGKAFRCECCNRLKG